MFPTTLQSTRSPARLIGGILLPCWRCRVVHDADKGYPKWEEAVDVPFSTRLQAHGVKRELGLREQCQSGEP